MSQPTLKPETRPSVLFEPGLRDYVFLGLAAALVLSLALAVHSSLVPGIMVGLLATAGLLARFTISPGIVIVLTGYFLIDPYLYILAATGPRAWRPGQTSLEMVFGITDVIVIMALMTYLIAQYRVYSLLNHAIPPFRRPPRPPAPGGKRPPVRRPGAHVRESEFHRLFAVAVAAAILGQLLALILFQLGPSEELTFGRRGRPRSDLDQRIDRTAILLWALVIVGTVLTAAAAYLRTRRANRDVALQFLEDTVWNESHREQTRLRRWINWRRWWHRK